MKNQKFESKLNVDDKKNIEIRIEIWDRNEMDFNHLLQFQVRTMTHLLLLGLIIYTKKLTDT